jgi:hypothetical protein
MLARQHRDRDSLLLKKRADYFFASQACHRPEVALFSNLLLSLGPTVVIGGFLRDICISGNFNSDVDFVVAPASISEFERLVGHFGGRANRFGGFGITLNRWKVDVWPLERTWAAVSGHVAVSCLDDLMKVTFFDWDAILYSVGDQKLISGHAYFDRIRTRVIDVNLEPNPNPVGNAVRALRYAYRWGAQFGERLASHVVKQIKDHGWSTLVDGERRSFQRPILGGFDSEAIVSVLQDFSRRGGKAARLPLRLVQDEIELIGGCTRDRFPVQHRSHYSSLESEGRRATGS